MSLLNRRDVLRTGVALASASLLGRADLACAEAQAAGQAPGGRERLLMDFGWKFMMGNGSDPKRDLDFGNGQGDFAKSGDFKFAQAKFDDSKWRPLDLPHDWAIELPFVNDKELEGHGFKPLGRRYPETSVGWYRRGFELPASDAGRRISIEFDGAFRAALVFVNGYFIGRNDNGYAPFAFDISDYVNAGDKNFIVVRMDASFGDGWFYEGAGIYRHVWLTKTDALHLGRWESFVRSDVAGAGARLTLGTVVKNDRAEAAECRVTWHILDAQRRLVAKEAMATGRVAARGELTLNASTEMASAALWTPETPNLYTAVVTVEQGGRAVDVEEVRFGVRSVRFDVDRGFFLNDKPVKIKGTCCHQDHAGVGAALPDRLQYFRVGVLKSMGSNALRTSHNMPTPELVEACDRMGLMMMCETRWEGSTPEALAQLETMVKRYRNSPAIILWSMGNEEWALQKQELGARVMTTMEARTNALDPTRRCTAAVNGSYGTGISKTLEVEGFNYNLKDVDPYHQAHPTQPLVGTETASAVSTRGIYVTDKAKNTVAAYDTSHPAWAELAEEWWSFYAERDFLPGGFAWTGFDYRGEPTPYGWPSVSSQFGIVDTCGFPKDSFFYYKAWWGSEPVLHLFPHWNWDAGAEISVWVHTNLEEVELLLNGKSLGAKRVKPNGHLEWKVTYEPGAIGARGKKGGAVVLTERRETVGAATQLKVTADRATIDADGEDVAVLRVEALDAQGRAVPTATQRVAFKVMGAGRLIGVGNGDPNCQEADNGTVRSLFSGLAQAMVQAGKTADGIEVEVTAAGLAPARVEVAARAVRLRPAI